MVQFVSHIVHIYIFPGFSWQVTELVNIKGNRKERTLELLKEETSQLGLKLCFYTTQIKIFLYILKDKHPATGFPTIVDICTVYGLTAWKVLRGSSIFFSPYHTKKEN